MHVFMNLTNFNQSDRCLYFSCPERSVSPAVYILLYVCAAAVVLLTVFGNLIVIISVFYFKQLHTPANTFVLSLAVSDFLLGALVMPPMLIWMIESCWIFHTGYCFWFFVTNYFLTGLCIYNVALIAVDRYLALSNPFLYNTKISRRTVRIVVCSNWFLCLVYNTSLCYFNGSFSGSVLCPGECYLFPDEVWSVVDLVVVFIFPCSAMIILYSRVFVIAKKHATAIREINNYTQSKTEKITSNLIKTDRKAAKVLGILVFAFLVCVTPYFIYALLGGVIVLQAETLQKVFFMTYLNSTLNPIVYAMYYPWFKSCIKLIMTLKIFQTESTLINVLS